MVRVCIVENCENRYEDIVKQNSVQIHRFPNDQERRNSWIQALRIQVPDPSRIHKGVCSRHFSPNDYKTSAFKYLLVDAVPRLSSGPSTPTDSTALRIKCKSMNYRIKRQNQEIVELRKLNHRLKAQLLDLQTKVLNQNKDILNLRNCKKALESVFSETQILLLTKQKTKPKWEFHEISKSIGLYSSSKKSYRYIRNVMKIPLPSVSCLQYWLNRIDFPPGILTGNMAVLNNELKDKTSMLKAGILGFDEMRMTERYDLDEKRDQIHGGKKDLFTTWVRGLHSKWKQIVHYEFDNHMSKGLLMDLLRQLHENSTEIVGIVHDMGTKNLKFWRELNICTVNKNGDIETTWLPHPVTAERIFIFPDYPHLLKLLRNHLIDSCIKLPDGKVIDKSIIEKLLAAQRDELKLTHQLTHKHITVQGRQRQKVRPAFQLFSRKVATSIRFLFPRLESIANFFDHVNRFSDLMNTRIPGNTNLFKAPFGVYYEEQTNFVNETYDLFKALRIGNHKSYVPFQKGFMIACKSLLGLYQQQHEKYMCEYLLTSKLNQDYIELSYSRLRSIGFYNSVPSEVECIQRIKTLSTASNLFQPKGSNVNCEEDVTNLSALNLRTLMDFSPKVTDTDMEYDNELLYKLSEVAREVEIESRTKDIIQYSSLACEGGAEYIAGAIASKLSEKYPELLSKTKEGNGLWVRVLSEGNLIEPSQVWFSYFRKFEEYFNIIHPNRKCYMEVGVVKKLAHFLGTNYPEIPTEVIQLYSKTRTCIRIQHINKRIEDRKFLLQSINRNPIPFTCPPPHSDHDYIVPTRADNDIGEEPIDTDEEVVASTSTGSNAASSTTHLAINNVNEEEDEEETPGEPQNQNAVDLESQLLDELDQIEDGDLFGVLTEYRISNSAVSDPE